MYPMVSDKRCTARGRFFYLALPLLLATLVGCGTLQDNLCTTDTLAQQSAAGGEAGPDTTEAGTAACDCGGEASAQAQEDTPTEEVEPEPRAIVSEELTFTSRGDELAGVVDRPAEIVEPRPAVVLLHDTGAHDRRGLMQSALGVQLPTEVAVYEELAETLAQRGYVVLRFDKRTCVEGGPAWCDYPRSYVEDHRGDLAGALSSDAQAAAKALRARSDIDPSRLYLLGHGEGAQIALGVAEDVDARGLVLLAPSPYPIDEVIAHQTATSLAHLRKQRAAQGNTTAGTLLAEQIDALERSHEEQQEAFAALRADDFEESTALGVPVATWENLFELHQRAMSSLSGSRIPILAVFGEHDLDLPADSAEDFEQQMASVRHNQVLSVARLTRLMVAIDDADSDATEVSGDVHRAIGRFLDTLERPAPDQPQS
jgi:uncharacterized protein